MPNEQVGYTICIVADHLIVSVIVPTKNSSKTLEDCLQSIKQQSYKSIELIVVDNFSTDLTPKIAQSHTQSFYSKGPERSPQRNFGVSKAHGKYVVIIDSDMILSKNVIEEGVNLMEREPDLAGIVIPEESFGAGFWAQCKKLERSFYVGIPFMEAARMFKKTDYVKLGGYNKKLVSGEDWDLSQRMESIGRLGRTNSFIYHNEGHISLWKTIKKKYYYATEFKDYTLKNKITNSANKQTSLVWRYWLFLSHPIKLFKNPILGLGMLFMKTCEFGFGKLGMLSSKYKTSSGD